MTMQEDPAIAAARAHVQANQPAMESNPDDRPVDRVVTSRENEVLVPDQNFPQQDDYFGFDHQERFFFPDKVSYVILKSLNEGDRKRYVNQSNRRLAIKRATGDAEMSMAPGDEKHNLLKVAIVGWNLVRGGNPVAFNTNMLEQFLNNTNPRLVDDIEAKIHEMNPWLDSEASIEELEKEIAQLTETLNRKREEEAGKGTSEK